MRENWEIKQNLSSFLLLNKIMKASDFSLPDQKGKVHKLSDYRGQFVVLYFYPKDDTPGCTIEAKEFNNDLKKFEESMGYTSPWEKFAVRGTIVLLAGFSAYPLYNGLRKVIDPAITKNLDMVDGLTVGPGMVGYRLEF